MWLFFLKDNLQKTIIYIIILNKYPFNKIQIEAEHVSGNLASQSYNFEKKDWILQTNKTYTKTSFIYLRNSYWLPAPTMCQALATMTFPLYEKINPL